LSCETFAARWTHIRGQGRANGELESLRAEMLNETEKEIYWQILLMASRTFLSTSV
jgi:hypothetical protein